MARNKASAAAKSYALSLREQVGEGEASRISRATLKEPSTFRPLDAFEVQRDINRPWHKPMLLDSLTGDEVSKLINALLDVAGRSGRRKNNR